MTIIGKTKNLLILPSNLLTKINGHKSQRIHIIITDPRSRHVILTRYPEKHKNWYSMTVEHNCDFVPTTILTKAKMNHYDSFFVTIKNGDLVVRRERQSHH